MQSWQSKRKEQQQEAGLEDRLTGYYGPELPAHPLPPSSWQRLQRNLGHQRLPGRRFRMRKPFTRMRRSRDFIPLYIQEAFMRLAIEARQPYRASMLHCTFKRRVRRPSVRVSHISKRNIRLTLPVDAVPMMNMATLDMLLATGLARYTLTRRGAYPAWRLAFSLPCLVSVFVLILAGVQHWLFIGVFIVIVCCAGSLLLLHWQQRKMVLAADDLVVTWIGRGRACEGLHNLAASTHKLYRNLGRWGEPSLPMRIARVCGTPVAVGDDRLTLVH